MKVSVTGSAGFLGRAIVQRLRQGALGRIEQLRLLDARAQQVVSAASESMFVGSIVDRDLQRKFLDNTPDVIFHLVSLPGGAAEAEFERGRAINLDASLALLDASSRPGAAPIVVYASSIAALGPSSAAIVADDAPLRPAGSYGVHKLMIEHYIADLTRMGMIDGRSLRPAGIVARPRSEMGGFASAWMSEIFHAGAAGEVFTSPVARDSRWWFQSIDCVADMFIHAAKLDAAALPRWRSWTLPACVATVGELCDSVAAAAERSMSAVFPFDKPGLPGLATPLAESLGFKGDGGVDDLVRRVLSSIASEVS